MNSPAPLSEHSSASTSLRNSLFLWTLPIYAVCSLTAMAGMNLGFLLVFLTFLLSAAYRVSLLQFGGKHEEGESLWHWSVKGYYTFALLISGACLLSLVIAKIWPFAYAGHDPEITWHGFQKIWYMICPFILISTFLAVGNTSRLATRIFTLITKAWWLTTLALAGVALIQFKTGWPIRQPIPTNPGYFHADLFFGHHLSTASIMIFPAFTAAAIAFGGFVRNRVIYPRETIFAVSGFLCLFLSYARTAWLAIILGCVLLFVRYLSRKQLIGTLLVFVVGLAGISQSSFLKERIENSMGIHDRLELWKANIDFFQHRPLTGIGWLKTQEMSEFYFKSIDPIHYKEQFWGHAHSNFFEMLGGTGLIGLIAFLLWSIFTFRLAWKTYSFALQNGSPYYSDFAWGIFISLILLHFNGLTNVTFWEGKVMHQQMLAVSLLFLLQAVIKLRTAP